MASYNEAFSHTKSALSENHAESKESTIRWYLTFGFNLYLWLNKEESEQTSMLVSEPVKR